jgi:hypothetical protein
MARSNLPLRATLTEHQVLAWAEAHHKETGTWPKREDGRLHGVPGFTWRGIDEAIHERPQSFGNARTLAHLLMIRRGVRCRAYLPRLTYKQILIWADAHRQRTGSWPRSYTGAIVDAPGETWLGVNQALHEAVRGLPGELSLSKLLAKKRGHRHRGQLRPLTIAEILGWAQRHFDRHGRWPCVSSGVIPNSGGEKWQIIDLALTNTTRGLPGPYTLHKLIRLYATLKLRAHWEQSLSDGQVSGGTPAEVAARILERRKMLGAPTSVPTGSEPLKGSKVPETREERLAVSGRKKAAANPEPANRSCGAPSPK